MTIQQFRDVLISIDKNVKVYHGVAMKEQGDYLCWERTGTTRFLANDGTTGRVQNIALYYFTKTEYPTYPIELENALEEEFDLTVSDQKEEFDFEYGVYCYKWDVEMVLG